MYQMNETGGFLSYYWYIVPKVDLEAGHDVDFYQIFQRLLGLFLASCNMTLLFIQICLLVLIKTVWALP